MNNLKQIKELIEAGDKATQGYFRASNPDGSIYNWYVQTNGKCETGQPHSGNFWDVTRITGVNGKMPEDAKFFALAANSRPAIKSLVDEVERFRKVDGINKDAIDECIAENKKQAEEIKRLREALESAGDVVEWEDGGACGTVRHIVEQALSEGGA